jgi:hypothetical protein
VGGIDGDAIDCDLRRNDWRIISIRKISASVFFGGLSSRGFKKKIMAEKGESGKVKRKIVKIHFFVLSLEKEKKNNKRDGQTHPWAGGAVVGGWVD